MKKIVPDVLLLICLMGLCLCYEQWEPFYRFMFPEVEKVLYTRSSMGKLVWEHLKLVFFAGSLSLLIGGGAGILMWGRPARSFLATLASGCQSFPPVAVLILVSTWLGFGSSPVIVSLFLYGLLPVVHGMFSALDSLDPSVRTAASALGLTRTQQLFQLEIPLTGSIMLSGIRIMIISHIGTGTLGATIGAGGLGGPIISGLQLGNYPYIIHASMCVSLLAILFDRFFDHLGAMGQEKAPTSR